MPTYKSRRSGIDLRKQFPPAAKPAMRIKPTRLSDHLPPDEIDDLIHPICLLADLDTSTEGNHSDILLDGLIHAARKLRDREGFLVVEGDL